MADRIPRPSISLPRWRSTTKSAKPEPAPPRKAPRIILLNDPGSFLANAASVRWWGVALAGGLLIVTIQLAAWIVSLFERGWALGAAGTLALAALAAGFAMATYLELAGFRRLREAAAFQKQFTENGPPEPLEKQRETIARPYERLACARRDSRPGDQGTGRHRRGFRRWKVGQPAERRTLELIGQLEDLATFYGGSFEHPPTFEQLWALAHPPRRACMRRDTFDLLMPRIKGAWERVAGKGRGARLHDEAAAHF